MARAVVGRLSPGRDMLLVYPCLAKTTHRDSAYFGTTCAMFRTINTTNLARPVSSASRLTGRTLVHPVRGYHEKVISHYERPRNVGSLPKTDVDVGTGLVGAPACGDVMKLQIRVDESGIISDVKFKTFGCGSAIASSSYMTERVKGLSLEEAGKIKNTEIAKELCLPPVKLHCSSMFTHFVLLMS